MNLELKNSYKKCRDIFRKYAKTYYLGAVLFNKEKFYHICAFYGFVRVIDNFIDLNQNIDLKKRKEILIDIETLFFMYFNEYKRTRKYYNVAYIYKNDPLYFEFFKILPAVLKSFNEIQISEHCLRSFFFSMRLDLEKFRYQNFKNLEEYMFGSAEIIGEVMFMIMEQKENEFEMLDYAYSLGKAFQLTNFIRDIREDFEMKPSRIYIPVDEQEIYNVNLEEDIPKIINGTINYENFDNFKNLIKYQIERCDKIYDFAQIGIQKLKDKKSIHLSKELYHSIHKKIIDNDYDVINNKCNLSFYEKIRISYQLLGFTNILYFIFNYIRYSYYF